MLGIDLSQIDWTNNNQFIDLIDMGNLGNLNFDNFNIDNLNTQNLGTSVCGCQKQAPKPYRQSGVLPSLPTLPPPACSCSCKNKQPTSTQNPLEPVGDCCSCGHQLIKPAPLSRSGSPVSELFFSWENLLILQILISQASIITTDKPSCGCQNAVRAPDNYQVFSPEAASIYFETQKPSES